MSVSFQDGAWRIADDGRVMTLHSRDAQREADRIAGQLVDGRETDLVVAIGLGLGFLLDALERRNWTGRVLAIEPEPSTVDAMRGRRDLDAWTTGDRLRVLVGPAFDGASECWRWFDDGTAEPPVFVHPVLERLRPSEVAEARTVLRRIRFDASSNAEARRRQSEIYLVNTLRNLPAIASQPDVAGLVGSARGIPAVIVAAGPSLDTSIAALRLVQDKVLVIAVDTALRPLLAAGVHPHAVVAVDPTEANGRHLADLPPSERTFLIAEGSIDPFAVAAFAGRRFFFSVSDHQPWPWLRTLGAGVGTLRTWGSVLTSAFDLALQIGADPIVFVGADLSYPGQRPYCRGVSFEEDWQRRERWGEPIVQQWKDAIEQWPAVLEPDVNGVEVRTTQHLVAFRNWLAEQMRQRTGRRFINAGSAGILQGENIEQMTPADLVADFGGDDRPSVRHVFRDGYQPRDGGRVRQATSRLAERAAAGDTSVPEFRDWQAFAPLVSIGAIARWLTITTAGFVEDGSAVPAVPPGTPARSSVETDVRELQQMAAAVPFVPLVVEPHRLETYSGGGRIFRFRTTAAAIMICAMRPLQGAVAENGVPLTRVYDLDQVVPGTYAVCRDLVVFRASDESDPRSNGRRYTILVPSPVAYLEQLPLAEVLARDI